MALDLIKPCKDMTIGDWREVILFLNPNMELLNETPPKHNEEVVCHCKLCNGTLYKLPQRVKDNVYRKIRQKSDAPWCPICSGKQTHQGINDLATSHPELVKYFKDKKDATKYTANSNKYVELECPECHEIKKLKVEDLVNYGFHCKKCDASESYPNKFCRALLSLLPVDERDTEYVDAWTQGKRYDGYFRIGNKKYLLEFDGSQHFRDTNWATKEYQQKNDELKDRLAMQNGFTLIRIDCRDTSFLTIKENIYKSILSEIFDLNSIDWDVLYEKASAGVMKEIIGLYNTYGLTNVEMANYIDYSPCTIGQYLTKANELGLVDYRPFKYELDTELVKEVCSFFINNQNYSNKQLAKKFGVNSTRIRKYLKRGLKEGLISLTQFTDDAFNNGRFSDIELNCL